MNTLQIGTTLNRIGNLVMWAGSLLSLVCAALVVFYNSGLSSGYPTSGTTWIIGLSVGVGGSFLSVIGGYLVKGFGAHIYLLHEINQKMSKR